jgi:hypothetical protein
MSEAAAFKDDQAPKIFEPGHSACIQSHTDDLKDHGAAVDDPPATGDGSASEKSLAWEIKP